MQMPDFGMVGSAIGSFGAASGDLITQQGYYRAAKGYTDAGNIAFESGKIAQTSGAIQQSQEKRELYKSLAGTEAAAGHAGFSLDGSMQDVLRSSASQGALQQALTGAQTQINFNNYNQQAKAYYSESDQATAQGNAAGQKSGSDMMSGIASLVGVGAMMLL